MPPKAPAFSKEEVEKYFEVGKLQKGRSRAIQVHAISALKNSGLKEAVQWLTKESLKVDVVTSGGSSTE